MRINIQVVRNLNRHTVLYLAKGFYACFILGKGIEVWHNCKGWHWHLAIS